MEGNDKMKVKKFIASLLILPIIISLLATDILAADTVKFSIGPSVTRASPTPTALKNTIP